MIKDRKNSDIVKEEGSLVLMSTWKNTYDKVFLFFFWWFIVTNALVLLVFIFGLIGFGFAVAKSKK